MAFEEYEALTIDQLRERGSSKWTTFPDAIGTFIAESDFGTAPAVTRTVRGLTDRAGFGYTRDAQSAQAARALADWCADRFGWEIDPAMVVTVPEVLASLSFTLDHLIEPGATVVLPTPNYMPFFDLIPDHGHEIIEVPQLADGTTWTFDYDAIERAFASGARLLMLINPANPTGTVYTREQLLPLVDIVAAHGGRVWADEVHAPLIYDGRSHVPYASLSPRAAAHTVTTTSTSKGWNLAGLKCAQIIFTNPDDAAAFKRAGRWLSHGTGHLGVLTTTTAYNDGREWLDGLLAHLQQRRDQFTRLVSERLPRARLIPAQGTYLAWLDLREYRVEGSLHRYLRHSARVAGTGGKQCGWDFDGYFRMNFATPAHVIDETIDRMARALPT